MSRFLLADPRFRPLFVCQLLSAFGDNLLRNALGILVLWSAGTQGEHQGWMVAAAAGAFVAPSILLSGLGGELADRMDKARLIRLLKLADLVVAAAAAVGLAAGRLGMVFVALVGSGAVAALFGPVKYGILPDQLGRERLAAANALVEGATFAAILAGSVGAGVLVGHGGGAALVAVVVTVGAALSWVSARMIPATARAAPHLVVRVNLLASTRDLLRDLRRDRRSWRAALASAWFWMLGAAVLSLLPGLVHDVLRGGARENGAFLGLFAVGVAGGSALASFLAGGRIVLVTAALGCGIAGASLVEVWHLTRAGVAQPWPLFLALLVTAAGAGMLAVPVQAAVQTWAMPERRARAVGGMNVLAAVGMALATALLVVAQRLGASEPALLGVVGLLCLLLAPVLLMTLPGNLTGELAWVVFRLFCRIELHGGEHLQGVGQCVVLVPDHASCFDAGLVLAITGERPLFLVDMQQHRFRWVRWLLALAPVVPLMPADARWLSAVRTLLQAAQGDARLLILPGGLRAAVGLAIRRRGETETLAAAVDTLVVPVRVDGVEGALLSKVVASVLQPVRLKVSSQAIADAQAALDHPSAPFEAGAAARRVRQFRE